MITALAAFLHHHNTHRSAKMPYGQDFIDPKQIQQFLQDMKSLSKAGAPGGGWHRQRIVGVRRTRGSAGCRVIAVIGIKSMTESWRDIFIIF